MKYKILILILALFIIVPNADAWFRLLNCTETDDGREYDLPGETTFGYIYNGNYGSMTYSDYCEGPWLKEFHCYFDYIQLSTQWCSKGCELGACLNNRLSSSCRNLIDIFESTYNASSEAGNYDSRADFNVDGVVDRDDMITLIQNVEDGDWCNRQILRTVLPTEICAGKLSRFFNASSGLTCANISFDRRVDFNNDGIVDGVDGEILDQNVYDKAWCETQINNTKDSCPVLCADGGRECERLPIILVHGLGGGAWTYDLYFKRKLGEIYPGEYIESIDLPSNMIACSWDHIFEISKAVKDAMNVTGKDKVDIIGHSMGGQDALNYIRLGCGHSTVRNLVTIAGANRILDGPYVRAYEDVQERAWMMGIDPANELTCPQLFGYGADFESEDETPGDVLYTTISSNNDSLVPISRSHLEGAENIVIEEFIFIPLGSLLDLIFTYIPALNGNHFTILLSEDIIDVTVEALNEGGKNDNVAAGSSLGSRPC